MIFDKYILARYGSYIYVCIFVWWFMTKLTLKYIYSHVVKKKLNLTNTTSYWRSKVSHKKANTICYRSQLFYKEVVLKKFAKLTENTCAGIALQFVKKVPKCCQSEWEH